MKNDKKMKKKIAKMIKEGDLASIFKVLDLNNSLESNDKNEDTLDTKEVTKFIKYQQATFQDRAVLYTTDPLILSNLVNENFGPLIKVYGVTIKGDIIIKDVTTNSIRLSNRSYYDIRQPKIKFRHV